MKSNFVKNIFIIFVIVITIFVVYELKKEKNTQEEEQTFIGKEEDITKEINLGIAEYDTINPLISKNKQIQELTKIIYEPILKLNNEYKIEKCLAKDWAKTSEKMYLIKLDDTIKWSDGNSINSNDVIFTIKMLKSIDSIYSENVENIADVIRVDDTTVRITLEKEEAFFEYNLIFPILSQKNYEGQDFNSTSVNNSPIGTGKYKITKNAENLIILEKNENYNREESTIEKITISKYSSLGELYNAFKLGKIDLITTENTSIESYIGTIGYNKSEANGREFDYIAINTQSSILAYKEIRQAINRAINRENTVSQIYGEKYRVQDYFLDYGNWLSGTKADTSYNLEKANEILQSNGWEYSYGKWRKYINNSTKTINLKIVVQETNGTRIAIAEMIKENLSEIGINTTIIKATDSQYQAYIENKNYDMIITGVTLGLTPNLETFFGTGNLANYTNNEIIEILKEAKNITKEELLKEKYARIREIYNDEVPYIGLASNYYEVASSWTLKGNITANLYNVFMDISSWYKN